MTPQEMAHRSHKVMVERLGGIERYKEYMRDIARKPRKKPGKQKRYGKDSRDT